MLNHPNKSEPEDLPLLVGERIGFQISCKSYFGNGTCLAISGRYIKCISQTHDRIIKLWPPVNSLLTAAVVALKKVDSLSAKYIHKLTDGSGSCQLFAY